MRLQQTLDQWLPTVARYLGLVVMLVLFFFLIRGDTAVVPGFVPAAGLMLYKTVKGFANGGKE